MRPETYSSGAIEQAVRARLEDPEKCGVRELGVLAMGGRVRLFGEATSYADKKRAARISLEVLGVRRVINQLRVMPN